MDAATGWGPLDWGEWGHLCWSRGPGTPPAAAERGMIGLRGLPTHACGRVSRTVHSMCRRRRQCLGASCVVALPPTTTPTPPLLQDLVAAPGPAPEEPHIVTFRDAVLVPPNGTDEGGGSVLLPGLVPLGTVLAAAADNLQASQAACCAACRANQRCNVYWFCETEARHGEVGGLFF